MGTVAVGPLESMTAAKSASPGSQTAAKAMRARRRTFGSVHAGSASGLVDFTALHLVGAGARRSVHARAHSEVG